MKVVYTAVSTKVVPDNRKSELDNTDWYYAKNGYK